MSIFEKIKNLIFREKEEPSNGIKCPHCENTGWWEGPEGGGSVNITCTRCHSRYNYMGPFGLQEIEIKNEHKDYIRDKKLEEILK